ncbi:MAG: hypothetical protein Q8N51_01775 [Gammaproteobacteria bacterium]|nr:hypothetical protein [Gammaproteobacteria bacterium]
MKRFLLTVAVVSLTGCLLSSWAYFIGDLPREEFFRQFQIGTLAWFVAATWWAYRK